MSFLATFSYKYKEPLNFILSSHYYLILSHIVTHFSIIKL